MNRFKLHLPAAAVLLLGAACGVVRAAESSGVWDVFQDPLWKQSLAEHPDRLAGGVAPSGAVSVNHFFVVSEEVARREDVVREIWRMLVETKKGLALPAHGVDVHPFGLEANRKNLELIIQFAFEQQMLPRMMTVDELFNDVTANLKP